MKPEGSGVCRPSVPTMPEGSPLHPCLQAGVQEDARRPVCWATRGKSLPALGLGRALYKKTRGFVRGRGQRRRRDAGGAGGRWATAVGAATVAAALRHPALSWEGPLRLLVQEGNRRANARLKACGVHRGAEAGVGWGQVQRGERPSRTGFEESLRPALQRALLAAPGAGHPEAQRTQPGCRSGRWACQGGSSPVRQ